MVSKTPSIMSLTDPLASSARMDVAIAPGMPKAARFDAFSIVSQNVFCPGSQSQSPDGSNARCAEPWSYSRQRTYTIYNKVSLR